MKYSDKTGIYVQLAQCLSAKRCAIDIDRLEALLDEAHANGMATARGMDANSLSQ